MESAGDAQRIEFATSYLYSPEYNSVGLDLQHGNFRLGFDYSTSQVDTRVADYGLKLSYEAQRFFVRALWRGISNEGLQHSLSGAQVMGVGVGYQDRYSLHPDVALSLLISAATIADSQPVGPLNYIDGEPYGSDDGPTGSTWLIWPKGRIALKGHFFEDRILSFSLTSGGNVFLLGASYPKRLHESGAPYIEQAHSNIYFWENRAEGKLDLTDYSDWIPVLTAGTQYMLFRHGIGEFGENHDLFTRLQIKRDNLLLAAQYTFPIKRDLYAGDAVPVGRLHALSLSTIFYGMKWLAGARFDKIFYDNDADKYITFPREDRVSVVGGGRIERFEIFAQVTSSIESFNLQASLNLAYYMGTADARLPIIEKIPELPPEHLPAAVLVGNGLEQKGLTYKSLGDYHGSHPLSIGCSDGGCDKKMAQLEEGVAAIFETKGSSGDERARKLIELGKSANSIQEKYYIIYKALSEHTEIDITRDGADGLFKIFDDDSNGGHCQNFTRAYHEYFLAVGIPSERLRDSFIGHNHRSLFVQMGDGRWVSLERDGLSPPITARNYWEALDIYSPSSYCRGYIQYDKGTTFTDSRVKAGCTELWQRVWNLTDELTAPSNHF